MGLEELRARTKVCEHCIDELAQVMYYHAAGFGYVRPRHEGGMPRSAFGEVLPLPRGALPFRRLSRLPAGVVLCRQLPGLLQVLL
jgi:hypothetical protein